MTDKLNKYNLNPEQLSALEWIKNGRVEASFSSVESAYFIGQVLSSWSKSMKQKDAKKAREEVFARLTFGKNEFSAAKKIYEKFGNVGEAKQAFAKTGSAAVNFARIWSALKDPAKGTTDFEKALSRVKAVAGSLDYLESLELTNDQKGQIVVEMVKAAMGLVTDVQAKLGVSNEPGEVIEVNEVNDQEMAEPGEVNDQEMAEAV